MKKHTLPACRLDAPEDLSFRVLTAEDAAAILSWQYAPPYDFYNRAGPSRKAVADLLRPEYGYHAIQCAQGRMIGYFCVGPDARVPGYKYDDSALDLGLGLDPALIGRGLGRMCLVAILNHRKTRLANQPVRATVASWNRRALRLCQQAGFADCAEFEGPSGREVHGSAAQSRSLSAALQNCVLLVGHPEVISNRTVPDNMLPRRVGTTALGENR